MNDRIVNEYKAHREKALEDIEVIESGKLTFQEQREGQGWVDTTQARLDEKRRNVAMYDTLIKLWSERK